jgi:hypothetical protein
VTFPGAFCRSSRSLAAASASAAVTLEKNILIGRSTGTVALPSATDESGAGVACASSAAQALKGCAANGFQYLALAASNAASTLLHHGGGRPGCCRRTLTPDLKVHTAARSSSLETPSTAGSVSRTSQQW